MKKQWRYRDIIDLEYLIRQDRDVRTKEERSAIRQRDRQIFLDEFPETDSQDKEIDRQTLLMAWLENRRQQEAENQTSSLPGSLVEEALQSARLLFGLAGLVFGASATFSLLFYTGDKPVNVFFYLALIVLVQLLMIVFLPLILMARKKGRSFFSFGLLYSISARLIIKLFHKGKSQVLNRVSAEKKGRLESVLGLINNKRQTYGSLFYWPIFLLFQLFGICFNVAVLLTTLFLITISDIAFGWQSTIQLGSQAVHTFVRYLALPWTWLIGPARSHPSLEEIEGSRIILKDTIYSLATTDLISWWPFLVLCVLIYGLMPRIVLFVLGLWAKRGSLKRLRFDQNIFSSLIQKMITPIVSSSGSQLLSTPLQNNGMAVTRKQLPEHVVAATMVLVPDDIYERCNDGELGRYLLNGTGLIIKEKIRIDTDYQAEQRLIRDLGSKLSQTERSVLILMEGWMPPIEDFFSFLKKLRKAIGKKHPVYIGLLGKPKKTTIFTPVKNLDFQIWQKKINSLGDPYLSLEAIVDIQE